MDQPPARVHLGLCQAGAVFPRCHSVVGRTGGGGGAEMANLIASSSTVLSFVTSNWWTMPVKNTTECSATSSTARVSAGVERERNVGW